MIGLNNIIHNQVKVLFECTPAGSQITSLLSQKKKYNPWKNMGFFFTPIEQINIS